MSAVTILAVSNYGMEEFPRDIQNHIASYVISTSNKDVLENFYESGLRPNKNNTWSAHQAWSALGFTQNNLIKGHYISLSLAETMRLTKKQRMTLKEIYKNKKEDHDYFWDCHIPRSMFTTLKMTDAQKTILEECPNDVMRIFLGKRNLKNTHQWTGYEMYNHTLIPENQDIYVIVHSPVIIKQASGECNVYLDVDPMWNAFCSGNMGKLGKEAINFLRAYIDSKELYAWSKKNYILTNRDSTYYFAPFTLTNDPYVSQHNWGKCRLTIQHPM